MVSIVVWSIIIFFSLCTIGFICQVIHNERKVFPKFRDNFKKGQVVGLPSDGTARYITPDPDDGNRVLVSVKKNSLYPVTEN